MLKAFHFSLVLFNITPRSSLQLEQFLLTSVPWKTMVFSKDRQSNMIKSEYSGSGAGRPELVLPPTSWVTMGKLPHLPEAVSSSF